MIHSISANKPSFQKVKFSGGLNVIIAERTKSSSKKDTRNGLGKSTLIEIIDFCLGGNATKGKGLIIAPLYDWSFTLDITIRGTRLQVNRSVKEPCQVAVKGLINDWTEKPDIDNKTGMPSLFEPDVLAEKPCIDSKNGWQVLKIEKWKSLLGRILFDLPVFGEEQTFKPSFRSLLPYFIRKSTDAYKSPFQHFSQQKMGNIQLHVAYLIGMNWEYAAEWQKLKDGEKDVKSVEKAIKTGAMERTIGTVGELQTQEIQLERQASIAKEALNTFKVHPQYESIQKDADRLTKEIHNFANSNISDRRRLSRYEESITEEKPPAAVSLESLYEESGLVFPDAVKHTLEEARNFHKKIIANRRDFLASEILKIEKIISARERELKKLTNKRAEIMKILETHGALEEMSKLQDRYSELQVSLGRVRERIKDMENLETRKGNLRVNKIELLKIAKKDHEERKGTWSKAVSLFNEHSQALYESAGKLVIDLDETGYKYKVDIERSGSEGIEKMKIFCFDLAVLQLQMENESGIDFLVHDTLMYDSVDARQRALAFEHAYKITAALGGQYICTINSDMIPLNDFSDDFKFENHVKLRLSDANASGSLLGIRFERPGK